MPPDITVVIPVRNGERFIGEAIDSVLKQTFSRWTLVVSDNKSSDGTRAEVGRYLSDGRVRLLESSEDAGMAGNFNKCLDSVETKYYILLCHDDFLFAPGALQTAYDILEQHPEVAALYSDLMFVTADRSPIVTRRYRRSGVLNSAALARRSILETRNLFGIPLLVRAAEIRGLRYDPALSLALDLDLSIRLSRKGAAFHVPQVLIGNRYHGANQTGNLLPRLLEEMTYIADKNGIELKPRHRALMRVSGYVTSLLRQAFLWYAAS